MSSAEIEPPLISTCGTYWLKYTCLIAELNFDGLREEVEMIHLAQVYPKMV